VEIKDEHGYSYLKFAQILKWLKVTPNWFYE